MSDRLLTAPRYSSLADMVKAFESNGDYSARNQGSTASGAYQFTNSTWRRYAGTQIASQYPTAADAPPAVQDAVFQTAVTRNGLGDWTCPGCNPGLVNYLTENPNQNDLPVFSGGSTSQTVAQGPQPQYWVGTDPVTHVPAASADPSNLENPTPVYPGNQNPGGGGGAPALTAGMPGYLPPAQTGGPFALGITTGLASAINSWISDIETYIGTAFRNAMSAIFGTAANYLVRFLLVVLAIVLILLALWRIMDPGGEKAKAMVASAAKAPV